MDRGMRKKKTVMGVLTRRFTVYLLCVMLATAPLFYLIVTNYYAEDLLEVAKMAGVGEEALDLERDTIVGMCIQLGVVLATVALAMLIAMRTIPERLWKPFRDTMEKMNSYKVDSGKVPQLADTDISEFADLNHTLSNLMETATRSFKAQKEFTENASHELQTPLAVAQSKLDLLIQDPSLTEHQAQLVQDIYVELKRMSAMSRNLLLLAKLDNMRPREDGEVEVGEKLRQKVTSLEALAGDTEVRLNIRQTLKVRCQEPLLESLINNLVVNALRHNKRDGFIDVRLENGRLRVLNPSDDPPLDPSHVFDRFYRVEKNQRGNGLGLAIVKAICDYYGWQCGYRYDNGLHEFYVVFAS